MHKIILLLVAIVCFSIDLMANPQSNKVDTTKQMRYYTMDTIRVSAAKQFLYRASAQKINDLIDTKLAVDFNWKQYRMNGKATISIKPHFYSTDSVTIDAKGFNLNRVALINSKKDTTDVFYLYDSSQIKIKLPRLINQNETYKIYIDYVAKPNERRAKKGRAIADDKGLYFINADGNDKTKPQQVWTQGEPQAASSWFPTIDNPNQKSTSEIHITRPINFISISNGEKKYSKVNDDSTETDVWKMDKPNAPYLFMMAVGNFAVSDNHWRDSIDVKYYVDQNYQEYADEIFGKTPQMMECFSKVLKYNFPWNKYSQVVVHDYVSGAMENTSATIHGEFLQRNSRELLDKTNEDVIAHELFHQWFGDLVTCESWSNVSLNESFATYGEYIWKDYAYGKDEADVELEEDLISYLTESRRKTEPIVRYYYNEPDDLFDRHTYQKGARVLHMLRKLVGDSAFFESLHKYLKTYQFKNAEINQLRLVMEDVSGMDLSWFFNQWYFSAGHPKLTIKYNYNTTLKQEIINIEQTQTEPALTVFRFPIKIDLYVNGAVRTYNFWMNKRRQEFKMYCDNKPDLVNVDGDKILLCEKSDGKTLPEFLFQFYHAPLYKDKLEALEYAAPLQQNNFSVRELFMNAMKSPIATIRKYAAENIYVDDSIGTFKAAPSLINLITEDDKARVRSAAVKKLGLSKMPANYTSIFMNATMDSSYTVCAEALRALSYTGSGSMYVACRNFETETNATVQSAIAKVYSDKGTPEHQSFFTYILKTKSGSQLYPYINQYSNYLYRMPEPVIEKGTIQLADIATNDKEYVVRLAAYDAIKHFKTKYNNDVQKDRIAVINSVLQEIRSKEKNPQLIEIYKNNE
jgi:aminopeptidase N